jgi:hypothetical protein
MPWRGTSGNVLAGWYTKYQFGGSLVAWPDMTEISLSAAYSPGAIRPSSASHEPARYPT